jgi:hypothetical protein
MTIQSTWPALFSSAHLDERPAFSPIWNRSPRNVQTWTASARATRPGSTHRRETSRMLSEAGSAMTSRLTPRGEHLDFPTAPRLSWFRQNATSEALRTLAKDRLHPTTVSPGRAV